MGCRMSGIALIIHTSISNARVSVLEARNSVILKLSLGCHMGVWVGCVGGRVVPLEPCHFHHKAVSTSPPRGNHGWRLTARIQAIWFAETDYKKSSVDSQQYCSIPQRQIVANHGR